MVDMSTTFRPTDHPRGLPPTAPRTGATRGSFAEKPHGHPEVRLGSSYGNGFPEPQANSLEKLSTVIDAVAVGANTAEAISEALGVTDREGAYYGDAAGYLGLVEVIPRSEPKTYGLTGIGEIALGFATEYRCQMIRETVSQSPGVQLLETGGEEAVQDFLASQGLVGATVLRRTQTISAWAKAIDDHDGFEQSTRFEIDQTRERAVAAAQHADDVRRVRAEVERRLAPRDARCPGCGNQLPLSGMCDFC